MKHISRRSREENLNTITHLAGVILTLSLAWKLLDLAYSTSVQYAMGITFFTVGMLVMFACSALYHWWLPGKGKRVLRVFDHISIYIMIATSYTPICIGLVGGALGWTVFGVMWAVAIGGTVYKITAIDRWPRLSLALYLIMGWSVVFIAKPVYDKLSSEALTYLLLEGFFYTAGTYFFAHDKRHYYHAIWHLFVLAGAIAHWLAILSILAVD